VLLSLAIILLSGTIIGFLYGKIKIPALLGMLVIGIALNYFETKRFVLRFFFLA
jgi:Kef-type K+ transport system membrane component KefB